MERDTVHGINANEMSVSSAPRAHHAVHGINAMEMPCSADPYAVAIHANESIIATYTQFRPSAGWYLGTGE
jgi:hypothetical protein